jgi:steroid 5-alpha reductase family enzyme
MSESGHQRNRALGWIQLGVAATIVVAYSAGALAPSWGVDHPIFIVLTAETVAILLLFLCSRISGNSGFVDPHWSLAPIFIALYFALVRSADPGHEPSLLRQMILVPLVAAWGIRLTYNWMRGFGGFDHEDWRYAKLRSEFGARYWLVELGGIHVFQMGLTFLGCLALYPALAVGPHPFGPLDLAAIAVTTLAIWIEMTADRQLHDFAGEAHAPGTILDRGLWRFSRHPNYFGEILFWWGLYLFGLAADPSWWWTVVGPLGITSMFVFVSLPLIEERQAERRPGHAEYARQVSVLVPWSRRS